MICLKKVLLLLTLVVGSSAVPLTDAETMLMDFIPFFKAPLKISIFVCWSNERSAHFVRRMMKAAQYPHLMQLRNDSIENIELLDTMEPHQQLAVIDKACPNSGQFLAEAGYRIYHRVRWILLDSSVGTSDGESSMLRLLSGLEVTGICELFYFTWSDGGDLLVKDVYRISMHTELITSIVAIWRNGTFEDRRMGLATTARRKNLMGTVIRTTIIYTDNYSRNHFDDFENPQIDTATRTSYHVMKILYDSYLNATLEKVYRTTWCYKNMPGICSDFSTNQSEAGAALMYMSQSRLQQVAFLKMPVGGPMRLIFKTPNLSITDNIFKLPFNVDVWSCTLSLIILVGGLFLVARLVARTEINEHLNLGDAVFNVISITSQQGSTFEVKGIGQKGLILVALVGLMFLEVSFSAKIISLIQAPSERINSLKDLLESRMEVASYNAIYSTYYLSTATEPIRRALYEKKVLLKNGSMNLYGVDDGIERVRKGLFALHIYAASGYQKVSETFDEAEKCNLRELVFVTSTIGYLSVKFNYTFREHFHVGMMRMLETGIYNHLHYKMHYTKPICVKSDSFRPLRVVDIRFAFELICWGLVMVLLILFAEIMWSKYKISRIQIFEYLVQPFNTCAQSLSASLPHPSRDIQFIQSQLFMRAEHSAQKLRTQPEK